MHQLNGIDYGIIGIISISVLFGLILGFVRQAIFFVTWLIAIMLGLAYSEPLAAHFSLITIPLLRLSVAFVLIVLISVIIGGILSHLISKVIKVTKFRIPDRIIGTLFGFALGIAIVGIVLVLIEPMNIGQDPLLKDSVLIPKFQPLTDWIKARIPEDIKKMYENPKKQMEQTEPAITLRNTVKKTNAELGMREESPIAVEESMGEEPAD